MIKGEIQGIKQGDARGCDLAGETRIRIRAEDERRLRVLYKQFSHRCRASLVDQCYMVCNF